jgi:hypothetical protein
MPQSSLLPILLAAVVAAAAPQAAPVDVSGVWILTQQTPQGEMTLEATFVQEKETLKVSMIGPQGTEMKGEGKIVESSLEWTLAISTPNGEFQVLFKAKVDGETMTGEAQMGEFGTLAFSAKRKK